MAEPTDRDRELAVAWLKASCTVASALVIMDLANQFAAAREEERRAGINSESAKQLIDACRKWRGSLEDDGWTEEDIRSMARPGLQEIILAMDEIDKHLG